MKMSKRQRMRVSSINSEADSWLDGFDCGSFFTMHYTVPLMLVRLLLLPGVRQIFSMAFTRLNLMLCRVFRIKKFIVADVIVNTLNIDHSI